MLELAQQIIVKADDFEAFCGHLEDYLNLASQLFGPIQGGEFNGLELQRLGQAMRQCGLRAVGQSSWGPTLFGFAPDQQTADSMNVHLRVNMPDIDTTITAARNRGATTQWL